jgi:hypothetical protein
MKREHALALFEMARFDVKSIHELPNGYWPAAYIEQRAASPWWLVETNIGLVKIGWRKRVIQISWTDTSYRGVVTADDVTEDDDMVHAWSYAKALEYLAALCMNAKQAATQVDAATDAGAA